MIGFGGFVFNSLSILDLAYLFMAHKKQVYEYGPYIEYEYKYLGRYGENGATRAPHKKATPEQMKKQNEWNREKVLLRIMRANFTPEDLWITLKLPQGSRISVQDLKTVRKKFFDGLRREYKKQGQPLKYIYRTEIGSRGGIHFHMLINRIDGNPGTDQIVSRLWAKAAGGHINCTPTYEEGDFEGLAGYILKPLDDNIEGQLTLWGNEEETKIFKQYNRSRNLIVPEPKTKKYKKRTVEKLIKNGPTPLPGYYILPDSITYGVNPYTGYAYFYYTEKLLDPGGKHVFSKKQT